MFQERRSHLALFEVKEFQMLLGNVIGALLLLDLFEPLAPLVEGLRLR